MSVYKLKYKYDWKINVNTFNSSVQEIMLISGNFRTPGTKFKALKIINILIEYFKSNQKIVDFLLFSYTEEIKLISQNDEIKSDERNYLKEFEDIQIKIKATMEGIGELDKVYPNSIFDIKYAQYVDYMKSEILSTKLLQDAYYCNLRTILSDNEKLLLNLANLISNNSDIQESIVFFIDYFNKLINDIAEYKQPELQTFNIPTLSVTIEEKQVKPIEKKTKKEKI